MVLAWKDGQFLDKTALTVSPFDFGFSRGVTMFEFTRLYGGIPFRLDDHIDRFERGAKILGIECPFPRSGITAVVKKLAAVNKFPHSGVKFYLTAGECASPGTRGFGTCSQFTPHLYIIEEEVKPVHPDAPKGFEIHTQGTSLKTVPFMRDIYEAKTINYARGFYTVRKYAAEGYDDILFTHPDGYVTECTMSNFFCVIDGKLCTPKQGMLPGVTRKHLLELAPQIGIPVSETDITFDKIGHSTEAFITGTFVEMLPVRKVDSHTYSLTTDGPVYTKLRKAFTESIAKLR